jgi:hypothetical protein
MKKIVFLSIILSCFVSVVQAQDRHVKILRFEVDKKEIKSDYKIVFYHNGKIIEPTLNGNDFVVPKEIQDSAVTMRFITKGYNLVFYPIYPSKFDTNWIVGVDKKPFDIENISPRKAKKFKLIYYLQFVSDKGDDTRIVVMISKTK